MSHGIDSKLSEVFSGIDIESITVRQLINYLASSCICRDKSYTDQENSNASSGISDNQTAKNKANTIDISNASSGAETEKIIIRSKKMDKADNYNNLTVEQKHRYHTLIDYATGKDGTKLVDSRLHDMVKIGHEQLVKIVITKRIVASFELPNADLHDYAESSTIKLKQKPIKMEINDEKSLTAALHLVDMNFNRIIEDKDNRRLLKLENARLKRLADKLSR